MSAIYFREQKRYTQDAIIKLLGCDGNDETRKSALTVIRRLKEYGVLKAVKKSDDPDKQADLSDLQEDELEPCDVDPNDGGRNYVFNYVGVIVVGSFVLRFYPKYLRDKDETDDVPKSEMRQVMEVIERYDRRKEQNLRMLNDVTDLSKDTANILDLYLFFLWDYNENGLYGNYINAIEKDGSGEILWDKTVNEIDPIFTKGKPIYPEVYTRRRVEDDDDYIRRLHKYALTQVTEWLKEADLLDLFGLMGAYFDDADEENLGDNGYILYRLDCELNRQFNSRKQRLLKALRIYFNNSIKISDMDYLSSFGTTSFNLVWEGVLRDIILDKKNETKELVEKIKKPHWTTGGVVSKTFIPDIVYVDEKNFLILDAKYYVPDLNSNPARGMPGIESISKQYLYQMAIIEVDDTIQGRVVENYFLFPTEKDEVSGSGDRGDVQLDILTEYDSSGMPTNDIKVRFLPAKVVFDCYLNGRLFPIDELKSGKKEVGKGKTA